MDIAKYLQHDHPPKQTLEIEGPRVESSQGSGNDQGREIVVGVDSNLEHSIGPSERMGSDKAAHPKCKI